MTIMPNTQQRETTGWQFIDDAGTFQLTNPHLTSHLYFPLVNEAGMMSAVTPLFHGDIKAGLNTFLLTPTSVEDLHISRASRNFWLSIPGSDPWSVTGQSAVQISRRYLDPPVEKVTLQAGILWHRVTRESLQLGLRADITSFVPIDDYLVELMCISITNTGTKPITYSPTAAIPIYGRSADNLRDHRHVTSLLHRTWTTQYGVCVRPTLAFDERGHNPNTITYCILGVEADGTAPIAFWPLVEDFVGEGGSLDWPHAVVKPNMPGYLCGANFDGYESIGALRFADVTLEPGKSYQYVLVLGILPEGTQSDRLLSEYGSSAKFDAALSATKNHWQQKVDQLTFQTGDQNFDRWMRWIVSQPILRRLYGNSFLPYHDYGRGGRGWRDLWQDCLALLLTETDSVKNLLLSSFAGVRLDGSNATIIGRSPGDFSADRNNIPRVWMDHGTWPFIATQLYIDQSGDIAFLLNKQKYFKDMHISRASILDKQWSPEQGTIQRTKAGEPYLGTVLEHLLIQHLTAFYNVGEHNIIRLEDADWNDGLDMAPDRGESVAFTALYASNLYDLSQLILCLDRLGMSDVMLADELLLLLDTLSTPVDYLDIQAKQQRLRAYFNACQPTITGKLVAVSIQQLADDLKTKADWLFDHLRQQEWIVQDDGVGWFNGYYDNDGQRVEGVNNDGVRMTLTGQVFTTMGGVATDQQVQAILAATDRYLFEPSMGGYRLNTDFGSIPLNLGRSYAFAFGHKENGAMFSHMAIMFANALYRRGFVKPGYAIINRIYQHCSTFETSRMYPGIPEYINARGRAMYPFLTGSASWLLLTMVREVFGVKGQLGDLVLDPKLIPDQFTPQSTASITTQFAGRRIVVEYRIVSEDITSNYAIQRVSIDGKPLPFRRSDSAIVIERETVEALSPPPAEHRLAVVLA